MSCNQPHSGAGGTDSASTASCCCLVRESETVGRSLAAVAAPRRRRWRRRQVERCVDVAGRQADWAALRARVWSNDAVGAEVAGGHCEAGPAARSHRSAAAAVVAGVGVAADSMNRPTNKVRATSRGVAVAEAVAAVPRRSCPPASQRHWHTASTCSSSENSH